MFRANPTLRCIAVLISLLGAFLIGAAILRANLSSPIITDGKAPTVKISWSIPASGVRSVTSSGNNICTVSKDGKVACYDSSGKQLFASIVQNATEAVISPDASFALAYSKRDRANPHLIFLDSNGNTEWKMDVAGSVWSADAAKCDRGACFAVGTGSRHVYLVTVGHRTKRYRRWKAPGVVTSIAFSPSGKHIFSGTWQDSTIRRSNLAGRVELRVNADQSDLQNVLPMRNTHRLFVRSTANKAGANSEAMLLKSDGSELSKYTLSATESTLAIASASGRFICIGCKKIIRHSAKSMPERHVALYDHKGRLIWEKGSMLLQMTPILVTDNGFVLIKDKASALYLVSPEGEIKQVGKLPAQMLDSTTMRNGSGALAKCADGKFYRISVIK